jgi:hypothetical protein
MAVGSILPGRCVFAKQDLADAEEISRDMQYAESRYY